jgi:FkbM family methyltransferase
MKTYVQVGTNDGNDHFKKMCYGLVDRSKIVLIEPMGELINEINQNYIELFQKHEIIIIDKAIVSDESIKDVEIYFSEGLIALSSLINRKTVDFTSKKSVRAITLNSLFKELNLRKIEELHIDTEGLDYEILLSIDLSMFKINLITCEMWGHENDDKNNRFDHGPHLLEKIYKKYSDYKISQISIEEMPSLKFEKI